MDELTLPNPPPAATATTRVLVVDDNAVVRHGLCSLLGSSTQIEVVGEASDGLSAENMVRALRPEVVLLDVRMPRRDGVQTAAAIADLTTVIMMTFTDDAEHIRAAVEAGASGYLIHGSFDADTLVQTVRSAALGSGAFSVQALRALRSAAAAPDPAEQRRERQEAFGLSERQAELMDLMAQGLSNAEIAKELFVSEKTVKNHINGIFSRLVVRSRSEAIAQWLGTAPDR